jgi:hypothetical protein
MEPNQLPDLARTPLTVLASGLTTEDQAQLFNYLIKESHADTNLISDGYHTFKELYEHRITNFLILCRLYSELGSEKIAQAKVPLRRVWRTVRHSDGELAFGGTWFVLGIGEKAGEQITYHLPLEAWDKAYFADTLEQAPEWDGHTSEDVLNRLATL